MKLMDELSKYIWKYYGEHATEEEKRIHILLFKRTKYRNDIRLEKLSWGDLDPLMDEDEFYKKSSERIIQEHGDEIFINRCTVCEQLAKTPFTKRCRNNHVKIDGVWQIPNEDG
jgi:hypothetical protein